MQGDRSESGPLIILDECHKAKNLLSDTGTPTLVGFAVMHMQKVLPEACVLYSSATGISEPRNMAYMTRLGTCGCTSMAALISRLLKAGLGASELFSCSLKASGAYLGRCAPQAPRCRLVDLLASGLSKVPITGGLSLVHVL